MVWAGGDLWVWQERAVKVERVTGTGDPDPNPAPAPCPGWERSNESGFNEEKNSSSPNDSM